MSLVDRISPRPSFEFEWGDINGRDRGADSVSVIQH